MQSAVVGGIITKYAPVSCSAIPKRLPDTIVGDTARAIAMSKRLLEMGVYVIGFGYPVVPEGTARLRVQISAAHEDEHVDKLVESLRTLKKELD